MAKLNEQEVRQKEIQTERAALRPIPRLAPQVIDDCLGEWRRLLRGSTTQGRSVLQRIIRGRITFTPRADGDGYDFTADTRFDKLFSGIVIARPDAEAGQLRALEHLTAEDTFDADYGRFLETRFPESIGAPGGT